MTAPSTRVLVLGGDGMLGHKLLQVLSPRFDVRTTLRRPDGPWRGIPLYADCTRTITGVDARDFDSVVRAVASVRPDVVVNGIGIIKQLREASDPVLSITVNSLFPHRLADLSEAAGARLIHISTDCVFSGRAGGYTEDDIPDPEDLYGRTKLLGEVTGRPGALTLRTSIIGRDFTKRAGLLEWFIANRGGRVQGYTTHRYSGVTTAALARIIGDLIERRPGLSGLYQVAGAPITKADLLCRISAAMKLDITIEPAAVTPARDLTLDGSRFTRETGITPPSWDAMIADLAADPTPYDEWRKHYAAA
jgi:dTDP-4-dehydrorhamnose reductase